ncbi:hypothetical protein G6F56_001838 [Rhizopus delemar]|nr:hypothetical protein G6F56_001838 [Rhizopus delemar]
MSASEPKIKEIPITRFSLDSNRPSTNNEEKTSNNLLPIKFPRRPSRSSSLSSLDKLRNKHRKKDPKTKYDNNREHKEETSSIKSEKSSKDDDNHEPHTSADDVEIASKSERPGSLAAVCQYELANEKQNNLFHALFKSVPQTDMLIEVYKCALHKEILLQGHVYVSEHHVCFKSNIFGWVTNLVVNFDEITAVEKRMTAKVIPNGLVIDTPTSKHVFASLLSRDQAYDQIVKIWKLHKRISSLISSSSSLSSSTNTSSSITQSYKEKGLTSLSDHLSVHSNDSAIMPNTPPLLLTDEDILKEDVVSQPSIIPHENKPLATTLLKVKDKPLVLNNRPRSVSDSHAIKMMSSPIVVPLNEQKKRERSCSGLIDRNRIRKTAMCPCMKHNDQYGYVALDRVYPGTVEAMDKLFYHTDFIQCFLECCENFESLKMEEQHKEYQWKKKNKSFRETEHYQLPYYSCVTSKKSIPDMPMGAVYCIQSRTCITRVNKHKVRLLITFEVVFKKSGLVSSVIENNAADDQFRQYSHLSSVLATPKLAKDLIKDKELLKALHLTPRRSLRNPKSWLDFKTYPPILQTLTCIAFLLVIASQFMLATRVSYVNSRFLELQNEMRQQGLYDEQQTTGPIDPQIRFDIYNRLEELKEKIREYDQNLIFLKNTVK